MTFLSALILGFLASAHCAGMCGGLQSVLQQSGVIRSKPEATRHLLAMNLGRLSIYVAAGFIFGGIGVSLLAYIDIPMVSRAMRFTAAVILILIGIQILFSKTKPLAWAERFGSKLWQITNKYLPNTYSATLLSSYRRGLIWGSLPCGLVYGALVTTLLSNSSLQGGLIMLGFGLGTLPSMILTGTLYQRLRAMVRNRGVQLIGGVIFIQGGGLMLAAPYFTSIDFMRGYPQLMSTMFCVS